MIEDLIKAEKRKRQEESIKATSEYIRFLLQENKHLEQKLEQTEKDLADYQFNYPTIKELEKTIKLLGERCNQLLNDKGELADQLTKAKELILKLYNAGRNVLMCRAEEKAYDNLSNAINDKSIEQFIKEIDNG